MCFLPIVLAVVELGLLEGAAKDAKKEMVRAAGNQVVSCYSYLFIFPRTYGLSTKIGARTHQHPPFFATVNRS